MILWKSGARYFEMVAGAYLFNRAGHELRHVQDKGEVMAFLRANPDQKFELSGGLRTPGRELEEPPDLGMSVLCGSLYYDSATGVLNTGPSEA